MKKREFQIKAVALLFKKIANVSEKLCNNSKLSPNEHLRFYPNVDITSKCNNTYFKLRNNLNLISIAVKQTGELSYRLFDEANETSGDIIYYQYAENDNHEAVIKKFADDISRLYKDFMEAQTHHTFCDIRLSYSTQAVDALKEYEQFIKIS